MRAGCAQPNAGQAEVSRLPRFYEVIMGFLLRPVSLIGILSLFFLLKARGLFCDEDGARVQKIAINITIPAAILSSFGNYSADPQLLWVSVYFTLLLFLCFGGTWLCFRRRGREALAFALLNSSGYNVGSLAMPVIQNYYGAFGVLVACMSDIGNALMANGGTYALSTAVLDRSTGGGFLRSLVKKLLQSPPFVCYLLLAPLIALDLSMPAAVVTLLQPVASANSFICMAMVGLSIGVKMDRRDLRAVLPVLLFRLTFGLVTAAVTYFCLPFSQTIREVATLVCVSPITGLAVVNTARYRANIEHAGLLVSLSILIGLAELLILATVFQAHAL